MILISNRVARPKPDEPIAGGLAAALLPAVKESGAIWVGASGRLAGPGTRDSLAEIEPLGEGALATVDMPEEHYHRFYGGFANSVLWPAFHSRVDLIRAQAGDYESYREINAFMARSVLRFAQPDAAFWVHDYHFLSLAAELRSRGVKQPIGFFLHTPFPSRSVVVGVPNHRELVLAMLAYDLIGFQTDDDRANFADYLRRELGMSSTNGVYRLHGGATRLATFPIGIDVKAFAERASKASGKAEVARLRASLQGRKAIIGVDRLDYSKGLLNRCRALDLLFDRRPDLKKMLHMLQIAVPTREQIPAYKQLQAELAGLVGEINGRHGDVDWTPIRYINKSYSQATLAGFYRSAAVGLVTPLNDGMNLVAKEYVAAQNPLDPGVLVLSEFAGAARQLDAAVLVNPNDISGMSNALEQALGMSVAERRERWNAMIAKLEAAPLDGWFADFTNTLMDTAGRDAYSSRIISSPSRVPEAREQWRAVRH